jgi:flavin-dependent dehydrogenase
MPHVLIAGGGVGGASLAILLGRLGVEVDLYERGTFPREKPCGEGLMPAGVDALERMGLASAVGGAPFYGVRYVFADFMLKGSFPARHGRRTEGRGQRRLLLDEVLFNAAANTPGVSAYTSVNVNAPVVEHGCVTGLIVDGTVRRGDLVVAADGLASPIRKALGLDLPLRRRRFGLRMHYRVRAGCEQPQWVDVFPRHGYELYVTPLPDGEMLVAALVEAGRLNGPAEKEFESWVNAEPELADRMNGAEKISPLAGCSPLGARAKCGVAPGAVLLGDAAGCLDPITGSGMAQAIASAERLSTYIAQTAVPQEEWIWKFERERQEMLRGRDLVTASVLWLSKHPWLAAGAFQAMRATPAVFSHIVSVCGGTRQLWSPQAEF